MQLILIINYNKMDLFRNFKDMIPTEYPKMILNKNIASCILNSKDYIVSFQNDTNNNVKLVIYSNNPCLDYIDGIDKYERVEFLSPNKTHYFKKLIDNTISFRIFSKEYQNKIQNEYQSRISDVTINCDNENIKIENELYPKYNDLYIPENNYLYVLPKGSNTVVIKNNLNVFFFNMNSR